MATSTSTVPGTDQAEPALRTGAGLMTLAAVAFIGYGGIFAVRNFSDSFLELGIGPHEVPVGKDAIQQFSPLLHRAGSNADSNLWYVGLVVPILGCGRRSVDDRRCEGGGRG